jgi:uncharacterized LabA/DUF88 family protein
MTEEGSPLPLLSRFAIMVDVGYIYACAGELLFGTSSRRDYRVDADKLIQALTRHASDRVRGELLRVYWYDAARDRVPTIDQRVIAQMPLVKLRLGNLNARGQQKGVDAQIRADMEALARHRAITDAILVAGDEDMVPAVEAAQAYGVRVHLWGVEPPYGTNQAERLVWESDTVEVLERSFVEPYFTRQPEPNTAVGPAGAARLRAGKAASLAGVAGVAGLAEGTGAPAMTGTAAAGITDAAPGTDGPAGQPGQATAVGQAPSPAQVFGERHAPRAAARPTGSAGTWPAGGVPGAARLGPDRERVEQAGEHVAQKWILTRGEDNIRDLLPGPILPPVIDKELLVEAEKELGLSLRPYQEAREWLRDAFWERVHRQFGIGTGRS